MYLGQNGKPEDDKNHIVVYLVAGFQETLGLFMDQATKHGVISLMWGLRQLRARVQGYRGLLTVVLR